MKRNKPFNRNRLNRVKKALLRISRSEYSELSIESCCDYIGWLHQYKKVDIEEIYFLADFAVLCMGKMSAEEEILFFHKYKDEIEKIK